MRKQIEYEHGKIVKVSGDRHRRRCREGGAAVVAGALFLCTVGHGQIAPPAGAAAPSTDGAATPHPAIVSPRLGTDFPDSRYFYPAEAMRSGQGGESVVRICVNVDGTLSEAPATQVSSGNAALDAAAVKFATAGSGHYIPGTREGTQVQSCGGLRVVFEPPPPFRDRPTCDHTKEERKALADKYKDKSAVVCTCIDSVSLRIGAPTIALSSGNRRLDDGAIALMLKANPGEAQNQQAQPLGCFDVRFKFNLH